MKLLGAREFIKMPAGTFYKEYWRNTKEECFQIIEEFKKEPKSFLNLSPDELHVFGDNSGSMSFSGSKEDDYIFYYDANVVGDACPETTLYLVIDENELTNEIEVKDYDENYDEQIIKLLRNDIIKIRDKFVNEVHNAYMDKCAFYELDKLSKEGNKIVDVKIIV